MKASEEMKIRINDLRATIKKATSEGKGLDEKKTAAYLSIEWGLTERKLKDYIKQLHNANLIYYKDALIWCNEHD